MNILEFYLRESVAPQAQELQALIDEVAAALDAAAIAHGENDVWAALDAAQKASKALADEVAA